MSRACVYFGWICYDNLKGPKILTLWIFAHVVNKRGGYVTEKLELRVLPTVRIDAPTTWEDN